jgi:hypothetical protein
VGWRRRKGTSATKEGGYRGARDGVKHGGVQGAVLSEGSLAIVTEFDAASLAALHDELALDVLALGIVHLPARIDDSCFVSFAI